MLGIEHGKSDLHSPVKIALHPIGRREPVAGLAAVVKIKNTGVFQIAIDDRDDSNALGNAGDSRPEAAHAAHDEIDLYSGLACAVELIDHGRIDQAVYFGDDPCGLSASGMLGFLADAVNEMLS